MVMWHRGNYSNVMCATWNFPMEPICEGIKCDTPVLSHTSVVSVKSDSFARIILLNILQRTQKHFRIIVRFVIEAFNGKSRCELISKMNMSAKTISSKPVHCAIIVRAPWNRYEFIFSIGTVSIWIIRAQMRHHHCCSLWMHPMLAVIYRQLHWQRLQPPQLLIQLTIRRSRWLSTIIATVSLTVIVVILYRLVEKTNLFANKS